MKWNDWIRDRWTTITVILALVLLPFALQFIYRRMTTLPEEIVLGGGPPGGQFRVTTESLAQEIERKLRIKVRIISTPGSVENFSLLQKGDADFGLYTSGTLEIMRDLDPDSLRDVGLEPDSQVRPNVAFVANVYRQPAHYIIRRGAGIQAPGDLKGKKVSLGPRGSGTYAMSLVFLEHFGLDKESVEAVSIDFDDMPEAFASGKLDAAFVFIGPQSPLFPALFRTGKCFLISIPNVEALAAKYLGLSQYKIPRGLYLPGSPVAPATDVQTVAANVQLLTRSDTHAGLVEAVTKIILSEDFEKKQENRLRELFVGGAGFAAEKPDFAIHKGALRVYETNPLLDPNVIDIEVKILSFILSFIIAIITGIQWMKHRRAQKKAHKLDEFMRSLLDIERRQLLLMEKPTGNNSPHLEKLLEEVTRLRHKALSKFSARELNQDRAVDSFLEMCHGISNEIHSRLLRARLGANEGLLGSELQSTARRDE